jgi:hypothetical protein
MGSDDIATGCGAPAAAQQRRVTTIVVARPDAKLSYKFLHS